VKVVWGMIAYGPFPYAPVYTSHMRAIAYASRSFTVDYRDLRPDSKIVGVGSSDRMYTHSAENQAVEDFLGIDGATHLFLTEMDMVLPDDTLPKLVALDQPIASGLYFLRSGRGQPCLYIKTITPADNPYPHTPVTAFPTERPFPLDPRGGGCPGLGCVLIRRDVFERVPRPWFDLKADGYGSDMYFYTKVREAGIPVWVDPTIQCDQMDTNVVGFKDYLKRCQEDPRFPGSGAVVNIAEVLA
jgi:hypothetical protein